MNPLAELQAWYAAQCDGEWEHCHGISIESLDNPGWWVKIGLTGTPWENVSFKLRVERRSPRDWLECQVKDKVFEGLGDPAKLELILGVFLEWADASRIGQSAGLAPARRRRRVR